MNSLGRHLESRQLHRFLDGELRSVERGRVQTHLGRCEECRARLEFYTRLTETARSIRHPAPPRELLDDILTSRAAGERVILPAAVAPPRSSRRLPAAIAAAGLVLAVGLSLLVTRQAGAGASDLRFAPTPPSGGEVVEIEYRPSSLLAGEQRLRLRARYRTAGERHSGELPGRILVTDLTRGDDGLYRGTLRVPPAAVYANFAVEDLEAEKLDTKQGRLWELLFAGPEGTPGLEAYRQRYRVLEGRNWQAATEAARRMTELYPDRAEGWSLLLGHELLVLDPVTSTARAAEHREVFKRLETEALQAADVPPDELAALVSYASRLKEPEAAERLERLMLARYPLHPVAIHRRVFQAVEPPDADEQASLLEAEWRRSGPVDAATARIGLSVALETGDREAILTWADRAEEAGREAAVRTARMLASTPGVRSEGIDRLRTILAGISGIPDSERSLAVPRSDFRKQNLSLARRLRGELGTALLATGRNEDGMRELEAAAASGWEPELFRALAEARLAAGDVERAGDFFALLAADPSATPEYVDYILARGGLPEAGEGLAWRLAAARAEMRRRILSEVPAPRQFPAGITVLESGGEAHDLVEVLSGRTTLLAFWNRLSAPSLRDLPSLATVAGRYRDRDVQVISVTTEPASPELESYLATLETRLVVLHDVADEASSVLGVWGTPQYIVVDGSGQIRLWSIELNDAVRVAEVLETEDEPGR
jgi:hypothetical protein